MEGYVTVPERIALFYKRYPEGSLQMDPPVFTEVEGKSYVIGRAYAYRTPDDARPSVGTAWEVIPGTTPFTRGSEIMNLETSAWGRCIGSLGIGIDKSIATLDEIEAAKARNSIVRTTEAIPNDPWQTQTDTPASAHKTVTKGSSMYPATCTRSNDRRRFFRSVIAPQTARYSGTVKSSAPSKPPMSSCSPLVSMMLASTSCSADGDSSLAVII